MSSWWAVLATPEGLAVESSWNIYVADSSNYRIQVFRPSVLSESTTSGLSAASGGATWILASYTITPLTVALLLVSFRPDSLIEKKGFTQRRSEKRVNATIPVAE